MTRTGKKAARVTRILIADDHPIVREGLRQVLKERSDLLVTGEAVDGHGVLEKLRTDDYDVVVLDLSMPRMGGLDVLRQVKSQYPNLPVIILSVHPEDQYAGRVLRQGASGYVTKSSATQELESAIRKVVTGGIYVSRDFAEKLASDLGNDAPRQPHETLSEREYNVMLMIAAGKTVTQIGKALFLSAKTVSTYRTRVLRKLEVQSTAELVRYAVREKLID